MKKLIREQVDLPTALLLAAVGVAGLACLVSQVVRVVAR
jgi:hypothetical protein